MKRLSLLLVGILSAVLVFSVVGFGTEMDSASTILTFNDLLVISVTDDSLNDLTFSQSDLESYTDGDRENLGTVTVQTWSLTDYSVGATFKSPNGNNTNTGLFEIKGDAIITSWQELGHYSWSGSAKDNKPSNSDINSGVVVDLTPEFGDTTEVTTASPNWPDGTSKGFSLQLNLGLMEKVISGNNSFDINFWIYEGAIPAS